MYEGRIRIQNGSCIRIWLWKFCIRIRTRPKRPESDLTRSGSPTLEDRVPLWSRQLMELHIRRLIRLHLLDPLPLGTSFWPDSIFVSYFKYMLCTAIILPNLLYADMWIFMGPQARASYSTSFFTYTYFLQCCTLYLPTYFLTR
jgi:hypothetical protein